MHSIDAHCFACGYDALLMVGGLMANHREYSLGPVTCETCKAITTANFRAAALICEVCKGADVSPMRVPTDGSQNGSFKGGNAVALLPWEPGFNDHLRLPDHYICPQCGLAELRFETNYMGHESRSID